MNFTTLTIGEREFECKLKTRDVVKLEKNLGTNPLNVLMAMQDGGLPDTSTLLVIVQASAKQDGKTLKMDEWYDLYDEYLEEGNSIADLLSLVIEIFQVSGLIPEVEEESTEKEGK